MEDIVVFGSEKGKAKWIEQEKQYQEMRRRFEEENNEKNRNKVLGIIIIALVIAAILGYLAVLNGRYIAADRVVFDQWNGEYVKPADHMR